MAPIRQGNVERRRWRAKCRARLSEHIGITIEPAQIRLLPRSDDPYSWKWLSEKGYLFSKNLSDHSTGAYKDLYKGVGVAFEAVQAETSAAKAATTLDTMISLNSKHPEFSFIDGVTSPEGRVLMMTTNHPENLGEALVRPGRIEQKIELGLTDREILVKLFRIVYEPLVNATEVHPKRSTLSDDLVAQFVSRVPNLEFSPAEVMSFLLQNRQSPTIAVANVESWVTKTRKQRE